MNDDPLKLTDPVETKPSELPERLADIILACGGAAGASPPAK